MALNGNDLYIAEFNAGKISKIDITDQNPTLITVISGLTTPNELLINGNYLYYSDNNADIVGRFEFADPNPTVEVIAESAVNFNPVGLAMQGTILYMGQALANRVSTVDVNSGDIQPVDLVTGVNRPLGIRLVGNILYIAEYVGDKISVKDISQGGATSTVLVDGVNSPKDIEISGSTIYILEAGENKITKVENILGLTKIDLTNNVLFPNPASKFVQISDIKVTTPYSIYSMIGIQISTGIIEPNQSINIEGLASGTYILKTQDGNSFKFIKE